jgi:hypothetical protein
MRAPSLTLLIAASLAGTASSFTPGVAHAQIGLSPVQDYINKTTLLNDILSNARATGMSQRARTTRGTAGSSGGAAAASPTAFRHAGRSLLPKLLAERAGGEAARRQEAERFFESLLDLYRRTAANDGFPPDELAYAMEYFVVNSYMTYHDLHDVPYEKDPRVRRGKDGFDRIAIINQKKALKPTIGHERAVYGQMRELLAANPAIVRMSDREKQELTELLAIMMGVNYTAYMRGVNAEDERLTEQARQVAREHLERLIGVPIARLQIDAGGLRK